MSDNLNQSGRKELLLPSLLTSTDVNRGIMYYDCVSDGKVLFCCIRIEDKGKINGDPWMLLRS
jgi:hypothetical protein